MPPDDNDADEDVDESIRKMRQTEQMMRDVAVMVLMFMDLDVVMLLAIDRLCALHDVDDD